MKKILVITAYAPGSNSAGQAFTLRLLQDLSEDHLIDLCYFDSNTHDHGVPVKNVKVLSSITLSKTRRLTGAASLPFFHPLFTCRFSFKLALYLRSISSNYDVVYFEFSQVFIYTLFIRHSNKLALSIDIVTQMYERRKGWLARLNTAFCRFTEGFILKHSGAKIYSFSSKDCELAFDYFGIEAEQVDLYIDNSIHDVDIARVERHDKFLFYGAWGRRENSSGLFWFLANVMPLLDTACRFVIVGSGISNELRQAAKPYGSALEFAGFIDNPYEFLAGARALVAPLFEGAGVKVKVLESLACGTPIVGTEVSFEGISTRHLSSCHNCRTAEEFAAVLNNFVPVDKQRLRDSFLEVYPSKTMGAIIREACSEAEITGKDT
jgi:glycosyltransferase involved in cell wall biosynthesis